MPQKSAASIRLFLALAVMLALSIALIGSLPGDALARPVFQSPVATAVITATRSVPVTVPLTATRAISLTPPVTVTAPLTATRPVSPTVAPTQPPAAPPPAQTPSGFLSPPTLSAPGGQPPSLLPGPGQPLVAPRAPTIAPRATPAPTAAENDALAVARLIDSGIVLLSYVWLCCGVFVLIGATLILVWLARRGQRRRRSLEK